MMIQRIVCFKFKEDATETDIKSHMDDFKSMKEKIPQVLSYSAGKTIPGDFGKSPEYDVMHYMTFENKKSVDEYSEHEVHQTFIQRNKEIWENVLVINSFAIE